MGANCEICGKKFKNQFALTGHKKMKNDAEHRAWREKNVNSNDKSEKIKSAVQSQIFSPEVLEKAKELIEKERRDEIINEYYKNAIQPMFENGSWVDNNRLQSILSKKESDHQLEISSIKTSYQRENEELEQQIENQGRENDDLKEQIFRLNDYINYRLDNEVRSGQEKLNHDIEVFNAEKVDFDGYKKAELSKLDKEKDETERKKKFVETHENSVAGREEILKNQEEEITSHKEKVDNAIKNVNNRIHNVIESEKRLIMSADETKKKNNQERKRIKDERDQMERKIKDKRDGNVSEIKDDQEKITKEWEQINKTKKQLKAERQRLQKTQTRLMTNRFLNIFTALSANNEAPKLLDGTNQAANQNNQGTYRNDIHPEDEKKNVYWTTAKPSPVSSSGEPFIQSGFPPTLISGDEVKAVESSGALVFQSGYIDHYSGVGNFNKNSKNGCKISS